VTSKAQSGEAIRAAFGDRLQRDVPLAPYTSARIGGPAQFLLEVRSADELAGTVERLWQLEVPVTILGGGSNVLIADAGVAGAVVINRARAVEFELGQGAARVKAESGASFGSVARRAAERGLSGLEWAATIPGTVGGAVVNNAGAHGSDTASRLILAEILQHGGGIDSWGPDQLEYDYRTSRLKGSQEKAVVLKAEFRLDESSVDDTKARMQEFVEHRRQTQPGGASWGSMFKNPAGDFAGRLIEAAGLKGLTVGQAQVSELHANFFVNLGGAKAADVWHLLEQVRKRVADDSGVDLELEIERIGRWSLMGSDKPTSQGAA
jgi:UDP-N-acetylmuramate dehydrogenase